MKKISLFVLLCICTLLHGQIVTDTIYYDDNGLNVGHPAFASYYKISIYPNQEKTSDKCRYYDMKGNLMAAGGHSTIDINDDNKSLLDGSYIFYTENGKVAVEENYKNGVLNGHCVHYTKSGEKSYEIDYLDGVRNGNFVIYYNNGQKKYEANYLHGKLDGKVRMYNEQGVCERESTYTKGILNGTIIIRDKSGQIMVEENYKNGLKVNERTAKYNRTYSTINPQNGHAPVQLSMNYHLWQINEIDSYNIFDFSLFNPTSDTLMVSLEDIIVSFSNGNQNLSMNQYVPYQEASDVYQYARRRYYKKLTEDASSMAKAKATTTTTTNHHMIASNGYGILDPNSVVTNGSSTTSTFNEDKYNNEYKKIMNTAAGMAYDMFPEIDELRQTRSDSIVLNPNQSKTCYILAYADIHPIVNKSKISFNTLSLTFKIGDAKFDYSVPINSVPILTSREIEKREDYLDDLELNDVVEDITIDLHRMYLYKITVRSMENAEGRKLTQDELKSLQKKIF